MCGSGTVGVEAVVRGKRVLCSDLDPLDCLITRAKCRPVPPNEVTETGEAILRRASPLPQQHEVKEDEAMIAVEENVDGTPFFIPDNLFHWYEPYVAVAISRLMRAAIERLEDQNNPQLEDAILASLASIVRRVSRADPQPVSALEVTKIRLRTLARGLRFNVAAEFRRKVALLANGYKQMLRTSTEIDPLIRQHDARDFAALAEWAGLNPSLVITSPAYCNAIEYWRRHKLEYQWLGLLAPTSIRELSRRFIGSNTLTQKMLEEVPPVQDEVINRILDKLIARGRSRRAKTLGKYFSDMAEWLTQIGKVLHRRGVLYVVIGPSSTQGVPIDTPGILARVARRSGFVVHSRVEYRLKNKKMQYPTHNGAGITVETLLCFRPDTKTS